MTRPRRIHAGLGVCVVIAVGLVAGCSRYSPEQLKTELTTGPDALSSQQADCIVDGLVAKGVPLDKYKDPSEADMDKITLVLQDCVGRTPGTTPETTPGATPGAGPAPVPGPVPESVPDPAAGSVPASPVS